MAEKVRLLKDLVLPLGVAFGVLGSIYAGIAAVSEAAAVGVAGTILAAWVRGKLSWSMLRDALRQTMSACGLLLWLTFGATALIGVYNLLGGIRFINSVMTGLPFDPLVVVVLMMLVLIVLGFFMDLGRHSPPHHADLRAYHHRARLQPGVVRDPVLHEHADLVPLATFPVRPRSI